MKPGPRYAAFLLGINVGLRIVRMKDLTLLMESLGYTEVKTILASGNVVFGAGKEKEGAIEKKLETALKKRFGFPVGVIVRPMRDIESILVANSFKGVKMSPSIRRYVTFLSEKHPLTVPEAVAKEFRIIKVTRGEAYSVLDLSKVAKTPDIMKYLTILYGTRITTRNWNTIEKVGKAG